jgi:hypothetical protein
MMKADDAWQSDALGVRWAMSDCEPNVEELEAGRRHDEEVHRGDPLPLTVRKGGASIESVVVAMHPSLESHSAT